MDLTSNPHSSSTPGTALPGSTHSERLQAMSAVLSRMASAPGCETRLSPTPARSTPALSSRRMPQTLRGVPPNMSATSLGHFITAGYPYPSSAAQTASPQATAASVPTKGGSMGRRREA